MQLRKAQSIDDYLMDLSNNPHKLGWLLGYDRLFEIHSQWIKYIFDSPDNSIRAMQAHRGSFKTSAAIVGFIRNLIFRPNETMFIIRKTHKDAQKILNEVQTHFERDPLLELFWMCGNKNPKGELWTKTELNVRKRTSVSQEANLTCYGINTSMTGGHPDLILNDDIITQDDRLSEVKRKMTIERFREMINLTITKKQGRISTQGTPWHKNDCFSVMPEPLKFSIHDISPAILSEEQISTIRKFEPPSLFAANYELKHIADEEKLFSSLKYCIWDLKIPAVAHVDPAYDGDCTTALTLMKRHGDKILLRGWVWRKNIAELYATVIAKLYENNAAPLLIEMNADKGMSKRDFAKLFPSTYGYNEKMNKHIKIITVLKKHWPNVFFAEPTSQEERDYLEQVMDYDENANLNDGPDSAASIIKERIDKNVGEGSVGTQIGGGLDASFG